MSSQLNYVKNLLKNASGLLPPKYKKAKKLIEMSIQEIDANNTIPIVSQENLMGKIHPITNEYIPNNPFLAKKMLEDIEKMIKEKEQELKNLDNISQNDQMLSD